MDVRCPQCQTLYELDDGRVRSGNAVTLKCSQCQHVFRLASEASEVVQENQRRWMIRRREGGDILYLTAFDQLHRWIMEQRVGRDDEISRTGRKWVALGSIGEFAPVFAVVDNISSISGEAARDSGDSGIAKRLPVQPVREDSGDVEQPDGVSEGGRERVETSLQFAGQGSTGTASPEMEAATRNERPSRPKSPTPAPLPPGPESTPPPAEDSPPQVQLQGSVLDTEPDEEPETDDGWGVDLSAEAEISGIHATQSRERNTRSRWWIVVLVFAVVGGGVGYLFAFERDRVDEWIGTVKRDEPDEDIVVIGEPDAGEATTPDGDVTAGVVAASAAVWTAYGSAGEAAGAQGANLFSTVVGAAAGPLYTSLETARTAAENEAEEGETGNVLARAREALERGQTQKARDLYHDVLEQDPDNPGAMTGLGWALLSLGNPDSAAAQFRRALHNGDRTGDPYIGIGTAERQLGNLEKAHDAYDRYLGKYPKGPKASIARYQMKQLSRRLGK